MALIPQPAANPNLPLDHNEVKKAVATGDWSDEEVLKIVVQDAIRAENYESTKQWVLMWPTASALYQSPYTARYWEGTQTERANVPFFTVATMVRSLVPQIINGLFYEDPPFMFQPRPRTSQNAARATAAVLAFQLDDIGFRRELELGCNNAVLFGTSIWKWGWECFETERKRYVRKTAPVVVPSAVPGGKPVETYPEDEEIEEQIEEVWVDRPTFEHIPNLRHVLVDPGLMVPDIRKAKYVEHRMYVTFQDLKKLRERPGFVIPSDETIISWFLPPREEAAAAPSENTIRNPLWDARAEPRYLDTTIDPMQQPLELLERWDNEHYWVVLQKKMVICNDKNPYGVIPFLSVNWWDVPEAFWGMGLGKTVGYEQRLQQGITSAWLDGVSLNLNGIYVRVKGKGPPTQSIRVSPGKVLEVDEKDTFTPLDRLPAVPEAGMALQNSEARAERVSGANELTVQGSLGQGRSSITRTKTGVDALQSGSGTRIQEFVDKIADSVIVPFLKAAHEMNASLMPMQTLRSILTDELGLDYAVDPMEIKNARLKFNITAGARLQAKRTMAQALPLLTQMILQPQVMQALAIEGKKINIDELLKMWWEVSDWRNFKEIIGKMTPDDQKRWMMSQAGGKGAQQIQGKMQLQNQKFQQEQQLRSDDNFGRAGRDVIRAALKGTEAPLAETGTPGGGQAFGTQP